MKTSDHATSFSNRPTTQNFEVARLINHGLLLEQCLLVCKQEVPEALVEANIYTIQHHLPLPNRAKVPRRNGFTPFNPLAVL